MGMKKDKECATETRRHKEIVFYLFFKIVAKDLIIYIYS